MYSMYCMILNGRKIDNPISLSLSLYCMYSRERIEREQRETRERRERQEQRASWILFFFWSSNMDLLQIYA
jgi:hypothetical protein